MQLATAVRHDEYYMNDGDVIFLVENKIFKIHKRVVTRSESSTFATMFGSSLTAGQTDVTPIVLKGSNSLENFEGLMRILYPPTLDDIWQIPIRTYTCAMRAASRYTMEDIKMAITRVVTHLPSPGMDQAIRRLGFMAEFPAHFSVSVAGDVFLQACSLSSTPSANDLKSLMAHPALVAAIIKKREIELRNQLQQPQQEVIKSWSYPGNSGVTTHTRELLPPPSPRMEGWLQEELKSFGFSE